MKALCISEPGHAGLMEIEKPSPKSGEVLLRMHTVGFCGSDLNTFRGINPIVTYPRIPGHEIGATIESRGPGVPDDLREGAKVLVVPYLPCGECSACRKGRANCCRNNQTLGVHCDGAMTEFITVPWEIVRSSEKLSFAELALVEPLAVGIHAVNRGRVVPTDTVVVLGCGAIGLGAVAGAASRDARVVAVDIDDSKLDIARACGAAHTVNSRRTSLHESLLELTEGQGADVVIEAIGLPDTYRSAVDEVCYAGRVVYIGYVKKPVEYETKTFILKEIDILGSRNAMPKDFEVSILLFEDGKISAHRIISHTVDLKDAGGALEAWSRNPASFTKIHVHV